MGNIFLKGEKMRKEDYEGLRRIADLESEEDDDEMIEGITFEPDDMNMIEGIEFVGEDPTAKVYLVLLILYEDIKDVDDEDRTDIIREWHIIAGRQTVYDWLKNLIESGSIDIHRSFILSGATAPEKAITVYRFMKTCVESNKVREISSFDIDDGNDPVLPKDDMKITDIDN